MIKQYKTPYIYVTPLIKPSFDCTKDKIKIAHTKQEIGLYEKLNFNKIEKRG